MRKLFKVLAIMLMVSGLFLFTSCSDDGSADVSSSDSIVVDDEKEEEVTEEDAESEKDADEGKVESNTNEVASFKESVDSELSGNDMAMYWNDEASVVVYTNDEDGIIYKWVEGKTAPESTGFGGDIQYLESLSPDGKYMVVGEGTFCVEGQIIVDIATLEEVQVISDAFGGYSGWSLDSSMFATSILNDKKLSLEVDIENTSDVIVWHVDDNTIQVVALGDDDLFARVNGWSGEGLTIEEYEIESEKSEYILYPFEDLTMGANLTAHEKEEANMNDSESSDADDAWAEGLFMSTDDIRDDDIYWNANKSWVIYVSGDDEMFYKWSKGEDEPVALDIAGVARYIGGCSPDEKYMVLDFGSSAIRTYEILDTESLEIVITIDNTVGEPIWNADSTILATSALNNKEINVELEGGGSTDVILWYVGETFARILAYGEAEYLTYPVAWTEEGLEIDLYNFENDNSETSVIDYDAIELGQADYEEYVSVY